MAKKLSFSQRRGLKKVSDLIQNNRLEDASRNKIWDLVCRYFLDRIHDPERDALYRALRDTHFLSSEHNRPYLKLIRSTWTNWFSQPFDAIPGTFEYFYDTVRESFFRYEWNEVYDFIEFLAENLPGELIQDFTIELNSLFESEIIPFRIINGVVADITNDVEVESLNDSLESEFSQAAKHFQTALKLLYSTPPDLRNSIKESISAVEHAAKKASNSDTGTLGSALKKLGTELHPAFREALNKLYGYTNDANGIRHALMVDDNITPEEAKMFLIQCSAFVNYLVERYSRDPQ